MYGYIYKTINCINGKSYIGKHKATQFEPDIYIGSGKLLIYAIKKYGINNFNCELLEECDTEYVLNEREKFWIEKYDAVNSEDFYNLACGGDGGDLSKFIDYTKCSNYGDNNWNYGKHYRWITNGKDDIRLFDGNELPDGYYYGRCCKLSEESRKLVGLAHKGKSPTNKGIPMTDEQKQKLSESRSGKCRGDDNPSRRPDVKEKLMKRYVCPLCSNYISTKSCVVRHIKREHINLIESASTIESIDWEKYSVD